MLEWLWQLHTEIKSNRWNQLDQRAVGASSVNAFKGCLNKIRETWTGFFMD